jgi:hypothetical protein
VRTIFIYALCEPGTRTVRYIGKTVALKKRLACHLSDSTERKTHLGNWLRSLGEAPNMVLLREVHGSEGSAAEIKYIRIARSLGMPLVNATDGGEGTLGFRPSKETLQKLSLSRTGQKRSAETRARMSAAAKGKPKSDAARAKMSNSKRGKKLGPRSQEWVANNSAWQRTPEGRKHRSDVTRAFWANRKSEKI